MVEVVGGAIFTAAIDAFTATFVTKGDGGGWRDGSLAGCKSNEFARFDEAMLAGSTGVIVFADPDAADVGRVEATGQQTADRARTQMGICRTAAGGTVASACGPAAVSQFRCSFIIHR